MRKTLAAITASFALLMSATAARAVSLYDIKTTPTKTPDQVGWFAFFGSTAPKPSGTATAGIGTILNSGNATNVGGYGRTAPFTLDRTTGYSVSFSVKLNAETHTPTVAPNPANAGFNVIVTSSKIKGETQPYGIELSFWPTAIFAKNVGFTQGETVAFNTTTAVNNYNLVVQGGAYKLYVNGSTAPILTGPLRQYTGFKPPAGIPVNPYTTENALFLGDESPSATAVATISSISAAPITTTTTSTTAK